MNSVLVRIYSVVALLVCPLVVSAQETPDVDALLNGEVIEVEQLVNIGANSQVEAEQVMLGTVRQQPRLLPEIVLGLALRMDQEVFDAAVESSLAKLEEEPASYRLLEQAVADAHRLAYEDRRDECLNVNLAGFAENTREPGFEENTRNRSLPRGAAVCSGSERILSDPLASPS